MEYIWRGVYNERLFDLVQCLCCGPLCPLVSLITRQSVQNLTSFIGHIILEENTRWRRGEMC